MMEIDWYHLKNIAQFWIGITKICGVSMQKMLGSLGNNYKKVINKIIIISKNKKSMMVL